MAQMNSQTDRQITETDRKTDRQAITRTESDHKHRAGIVQKCSQQNSDLPPALHQY